MEKKKQFDAARLAQLGNLAKFLNQTLQMIVVLATEITGDEGLAADYIYEVIGIADVQEEMNKQNRTQWRGNE